MEFLNLRVFGRSLRSFAVEGAISTAGAAMKLLLPASRVTILNHIGAAAAGAWNRNHQTGSLSVCQSLFYHYPEGDVFLPSDMIDSFIHDIKDKTGGADFKGFTNIRMEISFEEYKKISRSPSVLFIDVLPQFAADDLKRSFVAETQGKPVLFRFAPTYWYHEDINK